MLYSDINVMQVKVLCEMWDEPFHSLFCLILLYGHIWTNRLKYHVTVKWNRVPYCYGMYNVYQLQRMVLNDWIRGIIITLPDAIKPHWGHLTGLGVLFLDGMVSVSVGIKRFLNSCICMPLERGWWTEGQKRDVDEQKDIIYKIWIIYKEHLNCMISKVGFNPKVEPNSVYTPHPV